MMCILKSLGDRKHRLCLYPDEVQCHGVLATYSMCMSDYVCKKKKKNLITQYTFFFPFNFLLFFKLEFQIPPSYHHLTFCS